MAPPRPGSRPDRDRPAITRGPTLRPLSYWPARPESARLRERTRPSGPMPLGYGVIGSPTGSGPVSLGSSPGTPAVSVDSADVTHVRAFHIGGFRGAVLIKACLNGGTTRDEHPSVPQTPDELAAEAVAAVRAGAGAVHLHPGTRPARRPSTPKRSWPRSPPSGRRCPLPRLA